jgi:hypothetical protein
MVSASRVQAGVYGLAGAAVGYLVLMYFLVALSYGAAVDPSVYIVLGSSLVFIYAAICSLSQQHRGRVAALFALVGLGTIVPPLVRELIPQHNIIISPLNVLALAGYVVLLTFALFYPNSLRFSLVAFCLVLAGVAAFGCFTYAERLQSGEYDRPAYACFQWHPEPQDEIVIARDPLGLIDHEVRVALSGAGMSGTLEWTAGSWGEGSAGSRLLVLAQSKPLGETKLCPARSGLLIYAFDGDRWIRYPSDSPVYSLCLSLETQDSRTMIYQPVGGSKQGMQAFAW